jgi:hypothetical protein
MNEFVRTCRAEWRRLGVPDPIADEMAADLGADLEEAEAEGAGAEAVLGRAALQPGVFAATWAEARGVIGSRSASRRRPPRHPRIAVVITALALVATVGAALVLASSSARTRLAPQSIALGGSAPSEPIWVSSDASSPRFETTATGAGAYTPGSILLIAGLAGIVSLATWWWVGPTPHASSFKRHS